MSAFAPIHTPATSVVRRTDRPRTVLEGGVTWEELSAPGHALEPALLIVPAGATSGGLVTRSGETFVHLLHGALVFAFADGDGELTLNAGDSLTLAAASTWSWSNRGRREARAVWVEQLPAGAWNGGPPPERGAAAELSAPPRNPRA